MLVSTLLPTLVTLLSFALPAAASSHSGRVGHARHANVDKRGVSFSAPHYSLYLDDTISYSSWPAASTVTPYNRVLLAFWQTNGAQASAGSWSGFTDTQRSAILTDYHNAGIAVMVSAFGDDDLVITNQKDPVTTAQNLATFVKTYSLDGVDIDMEDFTPLENNQTYALSWLTSFHNELRSQLASGTYAISSTPTAWMYGSVFGSASSVYCQLNGAVGSTIDWYNFQFYNGQSGTWDTCEHVMWSSTNTAFLSLQEISNECSIPMSKITVGQLWDSSDLATAVPAEVVTGTELGTCLAQAKSQISYPETGVMVWAAHMDNWSGAITYLTEAIAAMGSTTVATSAASSGASASTGSAATVAGTAASVASGSASVGTTDLTSASGATVASSTDSVTSAGASVSGASASGASAGSSAGSSGSTKGSSTGAASAANASSSTSTSGALRTLPAGLAVAGAVVVAMVL